MDYETLLVEKEENIAVVKLNRPPVNSLNVKAYRIFMMFFAISKKMSRSRPLFLPVPVIRLLRRVSM